MKSLKGKIKKAVVWALRQIPLRKVTANLKVVQSSELLKGRTALITGGSSGIGLAIAKAFYDAGCDVVITGRNKDRLEKAIGEIDSDNKANHVVKYVVMDVSNSETIHEDYEQAIKAIGKEIDILVNNAGTMGDGLDNPKEFEQVLRTNIEGAYFLSKTFSEHLSKEGRHGNILNILSSSSFRPATNPYAISKWGMRGLTIGLARTLIKKDIVVNAIAPGPTATKMLNKQDSENIVKRNSPIGRFILPEEIANIAVILVSDMCRAAVGEIFCMTGGSGNVTNEDIKF